MRAARRLAHRRIRWRVYDDRLETESASAQRTISWPEITPMTVCDQTIALSLGSGVELFIPASVLPAEVQSLIARRIHPRQAKD